MNIEKLAKWLEPIMPDKIKTWLKVRDMSDPATKQLIEKQIISTAYSVFGDPRKAMLLSLPPSKVTDKPLKLGSVYYERRRGAFGLNNQQLLQHTAIFGRSGAGKSNVVMNLFRQLINRNVPVLFLDWKRNGREIIPHVTRKVQVYTAGRSVRPFPFNPFIPPPGIELNVYTQHVVDVLADAYTLGDGARSLMQKAIISASNKYDNAPNVIQIIHELEQVNESEKLDRSRSRGWKTTAMRALEELKLAQLTGGNAQSQHKFARNLAAGINVVELDSLSQSTRKFIIPLLFSWVYQVKLADSKREKLSLVLILEEAHNVLYRGQGSNETLTEQLLRQCREIGIGVILVDQQPGQLSSSALGNVHSSICLNLKDPADITKAAGLSLLDETEKNYLNQLEVGTGIVKLQTLWQRPFMVRFDHLELAKGKVTDDVLIRLMRGNLPQSTLSQRVCPNTPRSSRRRLLDSGFNGDQDHVIGLIHDILHHPYDGVRVRYERIGLSVGKANKLKQELLTLGWLSQKMVSQGNTRRVVLEITDAGRRVFDLPITQKKPDPILSVKKTTTPKPARKGWIDVGLIIDYISNDKSASHIRRESLEHSYWKNRYARRLIELGYDVEMEAAVEGGFADVVAHKAGQTLICEIETGRSDFIKNLRHGLQSTDLVIIVATCEKAMQKIERTLAEKELLIPSRVEIVLKDHSRFFGGRKIR